MTMSLSWQKLYQAALLEVQPEELHRRVGIAERAIQQRIEELKYAGPDSSEEQQAIADAQRALRVLAETECNSQPSSGAGRLQGEVAS
jgi:hypothetical protein